MTETSRTNWTPQQIAWADAAAADTALRLAAQDRRFAAEDLADIEAEAAASDPEFVNPDDADTARHALRRAEATEVAAEQAYRAAEAAYHATLRLTRRQFADLLGISPDTLSGYVNRGQAPAPDNRDEHGHPSWSGTVAYAYARREKRPGARTRG